MSSTIAYLQDEYEQEIVAMKQCLEAYIHGNPKITVFRFFLLSDQGINEIKQACGKASLETGKRVHLIYPVPEEMKMPTSETTNPPVTKSRNEVLQEIRVRFGSGTDHTTWIIDALLAAWDTNDMLTSIFGAEEAQTYLQAGFEPALTQKEEKDDDHE